MVVVRGRYGNRSRGVCGVEWGGERGGVRFAYASLLALKMEEEGAMNQGKEVASMASRGWKEPGNRFSPYIFPKECSPANTLT